MPTLDSEQHGTGTTPAVAHFYNTLRSGALSAAALAHGDANIGQECVLTPEEILTFARRAGITDGTSSGLLGQLACIAEQPGEQDRRRQHPVQGLQETGQPQQGDVQ